MSTLRAISQKAKKNKPLCNSFSGKIHYVEKLWVLYVQSRRKQKNKPLCNSFNGKIYCITFINILFFPSQISNNI